MQLHEREVPVRRANAALTRAVDTILEANGLTDVEYLQWLASEQQRVLKYMLRIERHGSTDKEAGLAHP